MNTLLKLIVVLIALAACASAFAPQAETSPTLQSAHVRWERLSSEDQERFRDRYERYRALSEDERRVLALRAERLREAKSRLREDMSDEMRAKLAELDPKRREFVMNELVRDQVRERGARIREKLPEALIDRLEDATPEERAQFLAEFQQRARARYARFAIEKMGHKLQLGEEEVARMTALTGAERAACVLDLSKRIALKEVAESGLPAGVTQPEWNALQALPPAEFFESYQQHCRGRSWRGGDPRPDEPKGPPSLARRIIEAVRVRPDEVLQFSELPSDVRRQRLFEFRRGRVIEVLRETGTVPADKLLEWSGLSESEFFKALRDVVPPSSDRHGRRSGRGQPDSRARQD